jgi:hypothetical protein
LTGKAIMSNPGAFAKRLHCVGAGILAA